MGYHAAPTYIRGGFVGVDVFFVISGFLITTIILAERDAGRFSVVGFYARRARRLFPALVVVLGATWLIGWYYLLPHEFEALGKHIAAGAGYFINFALKRESGYFDAAADTKPLLHLWSLAVEEQFYLVWPLLLMLVRGKRTLLTVIAGLTFASFVSCLFALGRNPASAFYLPQNRMWELGVGSLLAVVVLYYSHVCAAFRRSRWADIASVSGVLLVFGSVALLGDHMTFPGPLALAPTLGAALLIAAGAASIVSRGFLARPVLVFIGLISYPLYLWHWPLMSFAHILGVAENAVAMAVILATAPALAVGTYYLIERPLRRVPAGTPVLVAATAVLIVAGASTKNALLDPRLNSAAHRDISTATSDWMFPAGLTRDASVQGYRLYRAGGGPEAVLLFGDSHAEQYWPRLAAWQERGALPSIITATLGGCPPVPGMSIGRRQAECRAFVESALQIAKSAEVSTVVLAGAWLLYFDDPAFEMQGAGSVTMPAGRTAALRGLASMLGDLRSAGKAVWLISDSPFGLSPLNALSRSFLGGATVGRFAVQRGEHASWDSIRAALVGVAAEAGVPVLDPLPWLCDATSCPGQTVDGAAIYRDGNHLRSSYVRQHAVFIDEVLGISTGSIGTRRP